MDIRKDFQAAESLLQRLAGIGSEFGRLDNDEWPHLKNREDFQKVYLLPHNKRSQLEELYAKGRDCAGFMSYKLRDFNNVGLYPTFADYIDSFEQGWAFEKDDLQLFLTSVTELAESLENKPWAIGRMIEVFENQLKLLAGVRHTIELLKTSHTYLVDKGMVSMEKPSSISFGNVTGRVNINSTDNSVNHTASHSQVFLDLSSAISNSALEGKEKLELLQMVEKMKESQGSTGFSKTYKDFVQNAANHISVVAPFLPALTALLS